MYSTRPFTLVLFLVLMLWISAAQSATADQAKTGEIPIVFEAQSGERVDAFQGQFDVPSNWTLDSDQTVSLSYVRFPQIGHSSSDTGNDNGSDTPSDIQGAPIVYLAGGPGGSGSATARGQRFPLFMAMREFGDVIAFDQRGTGDSSRPPSCTSDQIVDDDTAFSDEAFIALYRAAAQQCIAQWVEQGIRPQDWTTVQSVRDLNALRQHLGAEKINLWGISYGSHLALAALNSMSERIERVILASVEGLDQTVKRPSETDAYFERLQAAINTQPELREQFPDIIGLIRRVHTRLEDEPITVQVRPQAGESYDYLLERRDMQRFASMMISDPGRALRLLDLYRALDAGITAPLAGLLANFHQHNEPIRFAAMPFFMDLASGISPEALTRFEQQSQTALLGRQLNFLVPHLQGVLPELDLGASFRAGPTSDVPVLVLSGTMDGRTYPNSQREAVRGLSNAEIVIVKNAGHNLFMSGPEVTERIQAFMRQQPGTARIIIENWHE